MRNLSDQKRCSLFWLPTITLLFAIGISTPAKAGLYGVDVSHWQGLVNWTALEQDGIAFGFAKATDGVNFVDSRFTTNMNNARLAGVPIGPYHYAQPDSSIGTLADPIKQDAVNEANDFVDAIEPYYTNYPGEYLRPVLDVEELPTSAEINTIAEQKAYLSDWIRDFNDVVQDRLGMDVIIYANSNYANTYFENSLRSFDFWLARWTYNVNNQPTSGNLGIWNSWDFWQWSDSWSAGGISPIDGNYFDGDINDLAAFLAGEPELVGDYNGNGIVDAADYTIWKDSWLSFGNNLPADGDNDGFVGNSDYDLWVEHYGETNLPTTSTSVPEPASCVLLAMSMFSLATRFSNR